MTSRRLYIIGNGFDLWHGIPSSYGQFKEYVREHDYRVFDAVENYLPADNSWSDLETSLADIDVDYVLDSLSHFMPSYSSEDWSDSGHHDFQYEVDLVVERLSENLRFLFGQWIRQLPIPTANSAPRKLLTLDIDSVFLTFNYTTTLSKVYAVPDNHILHIHGNANLTDSELILGHAWNPQNRHSLNEHPDIENFDTRLVEAHSILDDYFSKTFKPSAQLIQKNYKFFEYLHDTREIIVLGHSLSDVDAPYFDAIMNVPGLHTARWVLACRGDDNEKSKRLQELGVKAANINTVSWNNL